MEEFYSEKYSVRFICESEVIENVFIIKLGFDNIFEKQVNIHDTNKFRFYFLCSVISRGLSQGEMGSESHFISFCLDVKEKFGGAMRLESNQLFKILFHLTKSNAMCP